MPIHWRSSHIAVLTAKWEADDERVIYHPASNETHYLNPLGALVLDTLAAAPAGITLDDLLQTIASALADDTIAPADLRQYLTGLLARFAELGLATAVATA
ncbi:HPr-rel-A system PqqD family peptide chaperone [Rhodoferax sp. 4810]|uniref:HPr-rel-A system PqqD family peptide chaperone n=1 Tax=Thiospirillum jenense TaxID=1653858 RepID=A0A839HAC0_9GAMM|nr:HPr-rel-A system PqqD family peptide chaperone [Thiospirillum jenense]MBB1076141.1 HPr-rel-A system PqqD family peptide chaperone [Rhodoferax jenense]MBB1126073.1 HPr-rel-A system PqqD family peptide chaperone [Thiospirillum jenense]